jgi:Putative Flp pilus-assembly TadE/G-like
MRLIRKGKANRNKRERGVMIAVAALGFTTFLMAAGLAVDVSNFYAAGTELQNAADAAAMAGAMSLNNTVPGGGISSAVARATAVANSYNFNVASVNIPAGNVTFGANLTDFDNNGVGMSAATASLAANAPRVRFVRVNLQPQAVRIYIARMAFGGANSVTFNRRSIAGQSASGSTAAGTANDPGLTTITNLSRLVLVEDNVGTGTLSTSGTCSGGNRVYTKGCVYNTNMTPPCDALSATYEVIKGNTGSAGSDLNKQMVIPLNGCYSKDTGHDANTHPAAVNIRSGLNTIFNDYADSNTSLTVSGIGSQFATEFPPDTNIKENITYAEYKAGTNTTAPMAGGSVRPGATAGRRILIMGIMKKSTWFNPAGADGQYEYGTFQTYKYGAFFLKKRPTSTGRLQLEYIGDRVMVPGGGGCATGTSNTLTTTQTADMASGFTAPVLYR